MICKLVLTEKSKEEANSKLELWKQTLESKGFCLSRSGTEYLHYDFSNKQEENDLKIKVGDG